MNQNKIKNIRKLAFFRKNLNLLIFGGVIVLYLLNGLVVGCAFSAWSDRGTFGDMFGAVNALFSGLAFAGLIVTILLQRNDLRLQRKDLKMQRKELHLTREEMGNQTSEFSRQNEQMRKQSFESTFFHMMELQQQIVDGLEYKYAETKWKLGTDAAGMMKNQQKQVNHDLTGRYLFVSVFCSVRHYYADRRFYHGMKGALNRMGMEAYEQFDTPTFFDHYFRHLYTILKFVDDPKQPLTDTERYQYAKILRATLSRYELVWLFYNGLSSYGRNKLKPLLERYSMLKNLREELLSLCKENEETLKGLHLSVDDVKKADFSGGDYEFCITDKQGDKSKYHLSAFYTSEHINEGKDTLSQWTAFLSERRRELNTTKERAEGNEPQSGEMLSL